MKFGQRSVKSFHSWQLQFTIGSQDINQVRKLKSRYFDSYFQIYVYSSF